LKKLIGRTTIGCVEVVVLLALVPVIIVVVAAPLNLRTAAETDLRKSQLFHETPPPFSKPINLKIVTFNIANARLFTTNRKERILGIAEALAKLDPDIVGLQEAFVREDRELLLEALSHTRLKYHTWYPCATTGNGLFTISAWPIVESFFHRYKASNPWQRVWEGDWWAGKGVGLARVQHPSGSIIDFYNTHAQAGRGHRNRYLEVRTAQMEEAQAFIEASHLPTAAGFLVGDFNTRLDRTDFKVIIDGLNLQRIMNIDTSIDHIFAIANRYYRFITTGTQRISGTVHGSHENIFVSRFPSPEEMHKMYFGEGEETRISDHDGYISSVTVQPNTETNRELTGI